MKINLHLSGCAHLQQNSTKSQVSQDIYVVLIWPGEHHPCPAYAYLLERDQNDVPTCSIHRGPDLLNSPSQAQGSIFQADLSELCGWSGYHQQQALFYLPGPKYYIQYMVAESRCLL